MYVVLIGPSGKARKGTALNIARHLLKDVGICTTDDSITPEGLIRFMATEAMETLPSGQVHHSALCLTSELNVFLKHSDISMQVNLTDWYDCPDRWRYRTKNRGNDEIVNMCLTILSATAPDWIPTIFPLQAIGGGLTSRMILVVENKKRKTVPEPSWTGTEELLMKDLKHDLEVIKGMSGEFIMEGEAKKAYESWYLEQDEGIANGRYAVPHKLFIGYCERRATHVRKLCMAMSAARDSSLVITKDIFEKAIQLLELTERNMPTAFGGVGRAKNSEVLYKALEVIMQHGRIKRFELMRLLGFDVDAETLDDIENTLTKMKAIAIDRDLTGRGDVFYEFIGGDSFKLPRLDADEAFVF